MGKLQSEHTNSEHHRKLCINETGKNVNLEQTALHQMIVCVLCFFALVATFTGAASATDYYMAATGDNSGAGTSLSTAWRTPAYAVSQIGAGDTLWVVDGTYYESNAIEVESAQFGNATHWVQIKAYNGTPIWDGNGASVVGFRIGESPDPPYNPAYVKLDGIHIKSYKTSEIYIEYVSDVEIINCSFSHSSIALPTWRNLMDLGDGVRNITITNCNFKDTGNFGINLMGDRYGTTKKAYNITIDNCHFEKTVNHDALQISNYASDITVSNNTFVDCYGGAGTYFHEIATNPNRQSNIVIKDNTFTDMHHYGVFIMGTVDSEVTNNTIAGAASSAFIVGYYSNNVTIKENIVTDASRIHDDNTNSYANVHVLYENNVYHGLGSWLTYYARAGGELVIRDDAHQPKFTVDMASGDTGGSTTIEYTDGRVFNYKGFTVYRGSDYSITDPRWYPSKSNFVVDSDNTEVYWDIYLYNITLRPTCGHLYDVTVDAWDEDSGTYRITASSTETDNPTWINLTTKSASTTYNIKSDDGSYDIQATTGTDGVLRYYYTGQWDGSHTFEISEGASDATPRIINFQSSAPTQRNVTLHWGCSVSNIDHYTIYQDGVRLGITESQYYGVSNLMPNTPYTFSISATTTDGITGETATLGLRTTAAYAGSNTVRIADDVTASSGNRVAVPIRIYNATEVACAGVKLTYNASVVTVADVTGGDFTTHLKFDDGHAAEGWMVLNTYIEGTQLTGDIGVADLTLVAVGKAGDTSPLDLEIMAMATQNGYSVPRTVSSGLFTVVSDMSPPAVLYPSASQLIPDDTDGVPSWGETATLSVTVTDEGDILSVTIDLSAIGGSPVQPMTPIGDVWSVTTSASAGTPPQTYELHVCATDSHGFSNMSESVELVVMRNGDVTGDGYVNSDDVTLLGNYVTYPRQYTISSEFVADVTGDSVVDIADAMLLANYVAYPDQYTLR